MGFAGKLTRGVLQGLSGYYGEVAKTQAEERRAELLMSRETALTKLREDRADQRVRITGQETRETNTSKQTDELAAQRVLLPEQLKAEKDKESFKADLRMREQDDEQAARFDLARFTEGENTARKRMEEAGENRRARDRIVNDSWVPVYSKTDGTEHRYNLVTKQMVKFAGSGAKPSAAKDDDGEGSIPDRSRGARGSGNGTGETAAPPPPPAKDFSQFTEIRSLVDQESGWRNKTAAQRLAEARRRAAKYGFPVPE